MKNKFNPATDIAQTLPIVKPTNTSQNLLKPPPSTPKYILTSLALPQLVVYMNPFLSKPLLISTALAHFNQAQTISLNLAQSQQTTPGNVGQPQQTSHHFIRS